MNGRAIVFVFVAAVWSGFASQCHAQLFNWTAVSNDELEFSLTSLVDGAVVQSPSTLETGYNGATWFGNATADLPTQGLAQSFQVNASSTLQSIELRVGRFNNQQPTGNFEVSIYTFDPILQVPTGKLASVSANASDYPFDISSVPVSSFDFSGANLTLTAGQSYAVAVTPAVTFTGGLLTLQTANAKYSDGSEYVLSLVPEPQASFLWMGCAAAAVAVAVRLRMVSRGGRRSEATG